MKHVFNIQQLGITVVAKALNPTTLNLDFLKQSGIVPGDWQPTRPPVCTSSLAQILFQSQVEIVAQLDRILFSELIGSKNFNQVHLPTIARQYIETLPLAEYQAIGINLRGHAVLGETADAVRQHLLGTLLSPGAWAEVGSGLLRAAMQFTYQLEQAQFTLTVDEATAQLPDRQLPVLLFSGNFNYPIATSSPQQQLPLLRRALDRWRNDLELYRAVVETKFLAPAEPSIVLTLEQSARFAS